MKLIIHTDGASRGNPGHSSYGFTINNESGKLLYKEGKYLGINTNNFAEYSGVLEALNHVKENFPFKDLQIDFFMDSKLVVEQLCGRYKIKSPNLKKLIIQIKEIEEKLGNVNYSHVPRIKNKLADSLANLALNSR